MVGHILNNKQKRQSRMYVQYQATRIRTQTVLDFLGPLPSYTETKKFAYCTMALYYVLTMY